MARSEESRLAPARRRAAIAKALLAAVAVSAFLASAALARVAYPGHPRKPSRALSPPPRFLQIVRRNQLEAGILAPTQAPPIAVTGAS